MHIVELIEQIRPHLPFRTEREALDALKPYPDDDRMALVSAMYAGRSHLHYNEWQPDHRSVDRHYMDGDVQPHEVARILYEKNSNLTTYYDAFLRCAPKSVLDAF